MRKRLKRTGLSPFAAGLIALVLVSAFTFFAFTHANPFSHPFKLNAVFTDADNIKPNSPVRIAGVEVGKVTDVKPMDGGAGAAKISMEIKSDGLPIHRDAQVKIRPRVFLEGNFFVDLKPGTPEGRSLHSGDTLPVNQTSSAVQLGQVLSALQTNTRTDLQTFLKEYSSGLSKGGAQGFNTGVPYWEPAYKNGSLMNEATLGERPHDLSDGLIHGQQKVFKALGADEEALKSLVTNLNTTFLAFAREDQPLQQSIPALDGVLKAGSPALTELNSSLPDLRAFARDALPGVRSSAPTLKASLPFITQARLLVSRPELKGLTADLVPTIPALTHVNRDAIPLLEETRALSSCQNQVLLPFITSSVTNDHFKSDGNTGEVYKQLNRAMVGLAGESRIFDSNTPMFRVQGGGGPFTIFQTDRDLGKQYLGQAMFPIDAVQPAQPTKRPVFRPDVPCETQQVPDLAAPSGGADKTKQTPQIPTSQLPIDLQKIRQQGLDTLQRFSSATAYEKQTGASAPDPIPVPFADQNKVARKYGLKWNSANQLEKVGSGN